MRLTRNISANTVSGFVHIWYDGNWITCFREENGNRVTSTVKYEVNVALYDAKMTVTTHQSKPITKRDLPERGNIIAPEMTWDNIQGSNEYLTNLNNPTINLDTFQYHFMG